MVLIDGGSTHNFIKSAVAQKLSLPIAHVPNFKVFVGSGDSITCEAKCEKMPLHMQGHDFQVDTFVLDLKGADVVLGVQWMMGL